MSILKNFKKYPVALGGTDPKYIFFFKFATRSLTGGARVQGGLSPPPPSGDWVSPPYISILLPFSPHLSPKIPPKIQKKERGEEKGSGEALPDCALVICRLVHLAYVFSIGIIE